MVENIAEEGLEPTPQGQPTAARTWLRYAAWAYGDDLPVHVPADVPLQAPVGVSGDPGRGSMPTALQKGPLPRGAPLQASDQPATLAPRTLTDLAKEVLSCRKCKLCEHRTQVVFGEGAANAEVFFVGEAPGQTEDETGRPFVGRAGQLLDRIIQNGMGMQRGEVFIGNVNKCRPPGNRDPEPDEVAACLPYLRQQLDLVQPKVIVTLGRVAAHNLLGSDAAMKQLRGRDLEYRGTPVVCTWHPAYLLRNPAAKTDTWADIQRVNRLLGRPGDPRMGQASS